MPGKRLLFSLALATMASFAFYSFGPDEGPTNDPKERAFFPMEGNANWLEARPGYRAGVDDVLRLHTRDLGLGADDELRLRRSSQDALGMTHHRFRLYHRGVEVDGAGLIFHEKDGAVFLINGRWPRGVDQSVSPRLSPDEALALALEHMPAERYMWEDVAAEQLLQRVRKDSKASFFPAPELVLIDPALDQNAGSYRLAYRMEIFTQSPRSERKHIYIDAGNGAVVLELNLLCDQNDTPAMAETKYSGARQIITDSVASDEYRLIERGRGGGIETYDMNRGTNHDNAVDFLDEDNFWDNFNMQQDEVATDAHWGAEMTFDYFLEKHNYPGVDGENMPLIGFVHYNGSWVNAQWTGEWARFGDGDGSSTTPLTSLDVVAHEYVHGVTDFTSDLIYRDESGALNESFSDIFGNAVEIFARPEKASWDVGEDFHIGDGRFRSMSDPRSEGDPDTYQGSGWVSGSSDNGGVHTNSGVQNYWFYLLTEGGSGTNDNGDDYEVEGLGLDTAGAIAFRNMQYYLVRRSQYLDARFGAIQAAVDLYGECSVAAVEAAKAWYAVGLGGPLGYDLELVDILQPGSIECGYSPEMPIRARLRYNGCPESLLPGQPIPIAFQVNRSEVQWDTLMLANTLVFDDTITFEFSIPAQELAEPRVHQLKIWTRLEADKSFFNDTLSLTVDNILAQNVDMSLGKVLSPVSGCFLDSRPVVAELGFFGCDSLPAGTPAELFYRFNNGPLVAEQTELLNTLYRGDKLNYVFNIPADIPVETEMPMQVWIKYGPDYLSGNDSLLELTVSNPLPLQQREVLDFEEVEAVFDRVFLEVGEQVNAFLADDPREAGNRVIQLTGGDVESAIAEGAWQSPNEDNVWAINEAFATRFCLCADLDGLSQAQLRFRRLQTYSPSQLTELGSNNRLFSSLRVLINGQQQGATFRPSSFVADPWDEETIGLDNFLGEKIEICFESRNGVSTEYTTAAPWADNVFIDDIVIGDLAVGSQSAAAVVSKVNAYPNPGTGRFTVEVEALTAEALLVGVFDSFGRQVQHSRREVVQGKNLFPLDLSALPAGVYYLRLRGRDFDGMQKVVLH